MGACRPSSSYKTPPAPILAGLIGVLGALLGLICCGDLVGRVVGPPSVGIVVVGASVVGTSATGDSVVGALVMGTGRVPLLPSSSYKTPPGPILAGLIGVLGDLLGLRRSG